MVEQFAFTHRGLTGHVEADVVANDDPAKFGCNDDNLGFPVCTAEVRYSGGGYQAMFGWVQLVRSTDATTPDFEMDPNFLVPDVDVPYCYHGYKPTLFDSPGRTHRDDMEWVAHSFLAASPIEPGARQVTPLQGFSWASLVGARSVLRRCSRWRRTIGLATFLSSSALTRTGNSTRDHAGASASEDAWDESAGAVVECSSCEYFCLTGQFYDDAHRDTPLLREGLAT